jgi:hypothetical protein
MLLKRKNNTDNAKDNSPFMVTDFGTIDVLPE